jgi:glyceraldehyde 3-phosphate dehydrogenase-like protein
MPTVAINGLGRIGRAALKILLDADGLDLVAVNDIADADNLAYLHAAVASAHSPGAVGPSPPPFHGAETCSGPSLPPA